MFSFTKEEFDVISHALTLRESAMLRDAEAYRDQHNLDAQKDCMDEWRKTHILNEKISAMARTLHKEK